MSARKALLVGHCHIDTPRIVEILEALGCEAFDHTQQIDEAVELVATTEYDLVVGNRVLGFDQLGGVHLTERIRAGERPDTPVLILSAYAETQDAVVAVGGVRGFGKSDMNSPAARGVWAEFFG